MKPLDLSDLYKAAAVAAVIITATVSAQSYTQRGNFRELDVATTSSAREDVRHSTTARSVISSPAAERSASAYRTN